MEAYCNKCNKSIIKPKLEHLISSIKRLGGNININQCPYCKAYLLKWPVRNDKQEGEMI